MVENKKPKNISVPSGGRSTYSDITSGQPKQGRGNGNCGRGGNNNRRPNNRGGRGGNHNPSKVKKSSFEGACAKLKESIFDIGSGQTVLYNNTLDKILTYAGKNYSSCVRKSIEGMRDMSHPYIIKPAQATPVPGTAITCVQQIIFEQEVKDYVKEKRQHKMNMVEIFNVIHGQCTKEFIDQMRTYPEYEAANMDLMWFLLLKSFERSATDTTAKCTSRKRLCSPWRHCWHASSMTHPISITLRRWEIKRKSLHRLGSIYLMSRSMNKPRDYYTHTSNSNI